MTCNHGQAGECALGVARGHGADMAPVDRALLARGGCEAQAGRRLCGRAAHAAQGIPHKGDPTSAAVIGETLASDGGRDLGGDLEQTGTLVVAQSERTRPGHQWPLGGRIGEILARRWAAQAQDRGDLAPRQARMSETVDRQDGALVNHDRLPESGG